MNSSNSGVPRNWSDGTVSPRHDHVERVLETDQPGQPLRAAGAGQQAELHFRQRDLRARRDDAEVAAERQLEPATHADAADRGDHRLGAALDDADHGAQERLRRHLRRAEFVDVGAARKRLGRSDEHDRLDAGIGFRLLDAGDDPLRSACDSRSSADCRR